MLSTQNPILDEFAEYLKKQNIFISPLISPHRFPSSGLGIRANSPVPAKTRLMHVPTNAIIKWSDIAPDFMPTSPPPAEAGGIRVHSRLASWWAFSEDAKEKHGPWLATWPGLEDFEMGMPGLWPASCRDIYSPAETKRKPESNRNISAIKKRKAQTMEESGTHGLAVLPPGITGQWATLSTDTHDMAKSAGVLLPQQQKFERDLASARDFFPELENSSSAQHQKFLHMWYCVNTRCFSYWPTWPIRKTPTSRPVRPPPAPADRDEAMAMCPGMDLFNHTSDAGDGLCCTVAYDKDGFTVTSPNKRVEEGEELFISYGAHSEEDLWVEYGFMLGGGRNKWDGINIETVMFSDERMTREIRSKLKDADYDGGYTLSRDGVCWRTETAARLLVMKSVDWDAFVEGTYADHHDEENERLTKKAVNKVVEGWIRSVQREAENSVRGLEALASAESLRVFVGTDKKRMLELAESRKAMCLARWRQILEICQHALNTVKA
jgi:hypothetical protein